MNKKGADKEMYLVKLISLSLLIGISTYTPNLSSVNNYKLTEARVDSLTINADSLSLKEVRQKLRAFKHRLKDNAQQVLDNNNSKYLCCNYNTQVSAELFYSNISFSESHLYYSQIFLKNSPTRAGPFNA